MPTLALCIPAYNAAWCLPRLLNSAKQQKIPFDEILVYNDCSTDDTEAVAKSHGATVINGTERTWNPIGKNKLAEIATSEWLFFIDADDIMLTNFTETIQKWMLKETSPDIVLIPYQCIDNFSDKFLYEVKYDAEDLKNDPVRFTIKEKIVNFELIKKESFLKIGGFDIDSKILFIEDRAFAFKAAVNGLKFDADPNVLCIKYYTKTSMSSANMAKCFDAGYHLWAKAYDLVGNKYPNEICYQLFQNAIWAGKSNGWDTVKKSLALAKKINPFFLPDGSGLFLTAFKISPFYAFYLREMVLRNFSRYQFISK
jgi:glycosyltransferase involved in cell wall biosynthesis